LPVVRVATSKTDNAVSIEVSDHGIGMDEDTASRAFEPLFTTHARGTGLGLAVVRKIVQEHGGSVSLESQSNHGTKVTVLIPLSRDTHARLAKGEDIQVRGSL
jgi:signal transduction histidine kinase